MSDKLLETQNLSVHYFGGYCGVYDASFALDCGERLGVYGQSFSGKSSLLRALAGLEEYGGTARLKGKSLAEAPLKERNFSFCFPPASLGKRVTLRSALERPLVMRGAADVPWRIERAAREFGLEAVLDTEAFRLDARQGVLACLARALERDCDLFILDNPLAGLEGAERADAFDMLTAALAVRGGAAIYASDVLSEAAAFGPRLGIMALTRLMQVDTADEIMRAPAHIECINAFGLTECEAQAIDGGVVVDGGFIAAPPPLSAMYYGKKVSAIVEGGRCKYYFDLKSGFRVSALAEEKY